MVTGPARRGAKATTLVKRHLLGIAVLLLAACSADDRAVPGTVPSSAEDGQRERHAMGKPTLMTPAPVVAPLSLPFAESRALYGTLLNRRVGDLDALAAHSTIRALVVFSRTHYFLSDGHPRGIAYETMEAFKRYINRRLGTEQRKINVVYIPVSTEQLIPALRAGIGDIALANLTVTAASRRLVDFSEPLMTGVREIIVTAAGTPVLRGLRDLSGRRIHVRRGSSYFDSLAKLNQIFQVQGLPPVRVATVDPHLEDEDLLAMVNVGVLPMIAVDSHIAGVWSQALANIHVNEHLVLRGGRQVAWAIRQQSPLLAAAVNDFIKGHRRGTRFGNIMFQRYLNNARYVKSSLSVLDEPRLREPLALLQRYARQYRFDWTLIAAQAFQESGIDQSKRSHVGAVGVMQVMPSTAADKNVGIPGIHRLEDNIHAGIKYLRFIKDRYYQDEDIDEFNRTMLSLASYNAGPARVARLRAEARSIGLDPNVWFDNVERVAARRVGQEPVQYVRNILKYWLTYRMLRDKEQRGEQVALADSR